MGLVFWGLRVGIVTREKGDLFFTLVLGEVQAQNSGPSAQNGRDGIRYLF